MIAPRLLPAYGGSWEDVPLLLAQVRRFAALGAFVFDEGESRYSDRARQLIGQLASDCVDVQRNIGKWPGTQKLGSPNATRYVFTLTQDVVDVLSRTSDSMFEWQNPDLPEDLHFMRADYSIVLASVAHERFMWLELTESERDEWAAFAGFPLVQDDGIPDDLTSVARFSAPLYGPAEEYLLEAVAWSHLSTIGARVADEYFANLHDLAGQLTARARRSGSPSVASGCRGSVACCV